MNQLYWDASALVPLCLEEARSKEAVQGWTHSEIAWTWEWTAVEVESALIRRSAPSAAWLEWREIEKCMHWLSLQSQDLPVLRSLNRGIGLRAADAGHLFMFDRLSSALIGIELISFDQEMVEAARRLGLSVRSSC